MNSLKSACSFAKSTPLPLYQFQEHREPVFGCKLRVELIICLIRFLKTSKYLNNAFHESTLARTLPRSERRLTFQPRGSTVIRVLTKPRIPCEGALTIMRMRRRGFSHRPCLRRIATRTRCVVRRARTAQTRFANSPAGWPFAVGWAALRSYE